MSERNRFAIAGVYFALLLSMATIALVRNPGLGWAQPAYFWLTVNAPGTVLFLLFLHHRIRAVGPLVLAFKFELRPMEQGTCPADRVGAVSPPHASMLERSFRHRATARVTAATGCFFICLNTAERSKLKSPRRAFHPFLGFG